jgi:pimeloyl-ACP methyl ester carboxylesterase
MSFHRVLKINVTFLLLLLLAVQAQAQFTINSGARRRPDEPPKPKTIHGLVQDSGGKPVAEAHIFIRDTKNNRTRTVATNTQGLYTITGLPPDVDYEVTAEYKGKTSEKKLITAMLNREDNLVNFKFDVTTASTAGAEGTQFDTFDLVRLHASFDLPSGAPAPIPAVLLLHGFGEDRAVWDKFKAQLLGKGWAVMALDLRGHGQSKTKNQQPITADAAWRMSSQEFPLDVGPALDWLKAHPRLDSHKIVVIGYDVGANLALIAAGRFSEVRTVVAVKPNAAESLAMAGSAQDFTPRSALIVADQTETSRIQPYVRNPLRTLAAGASAGTAQAFQNTQITDAIFQWLKETY